MASGADVPDGDIPIRVVLADDSYLVREALEHVLAAADELSVVAAVADRDALLQAVDEQQPHVVVTDIRMPPTETDEGLQVAATLRETHPGVGVVVLSQYAEPRYGLALFDGGSDRRAYLLKERLKDEGELARALHEVAEGGSVVDPHIVERLVGAQSGSVASRVPGWVSEARQ